MQVRGEEEPSDVAEDVEMCRLGTRKSLVMLQVRDKEEQSEQGVWPGGDVAELCGLGDKEEQSEQGV